MGATLEQVFYEKLAEMPSDVSRRISPVGLSLHRVLHSCVNRKSKSYLIRRKQQRRKGQERAT